MAAVTRWVQYDIGNAGVISTGGVTVSGLGTRKYLQANSSVGDSFDLGTSNNKLYIDFDGDTSTSVTLTSGTDLDPRLVARDITEKIHNLGKIGGFTNAQCVWENNKLRIYSGTLGSSSDVTVVSGANTAHLEVGFASSAGGGGSATGNSYSGGLTTSGTYDGFFDEIYHVKINSVLQIGTPQLDGSNEYTGSLTANGVFDYGTDITYTISINVAGLGTTMGAGTGNVPTMSWTSTGSNDDGGPVIFEPPLNADSVVYVDHMRTLEKLLRRDTWFRERAVYRSPGGGITERYGIEWFVYELNARWIEGLQKRPLSDDWILLGNHLCGVFDAYFKSITE